MTEKILIEKSHLEELESIKNEYQSLCNLTPSAIVLTNRSGKITSINPAAEKIFQISQEKAIGMSIQSFCPPQLHQEQNLMLAKALQTGFGCCYETERMTAGGDRIPVDISLSVRKNNEGKVIGWSAVIRDLRLGKEEKAAIQRSEKKLLSILKASPTGIGVTVNRVFREVNDTFCKMVGYEKDELIGQRTRMLYANDDEYVFVGQKHSQLMRESGVGTLETKIRRKDGMIIDVLMSTSPIESYEFSEVVTFAILDITPRKESERKLLAQSATLDAIFNGIPTISMLLDENCRIHKINRQGVLLARKDQNELLGRMAGEVLNCREFNHRLEGTGTLHCQSCPINFYVGTTFQTGKSYVREEVQVAVIRDGRDTFRNYMVSTALIKDEGHHRILLSLTDITEIKKREVALRQEKEERNKIEHQFRQAQKMESIGRLAGGIAHDLNNLLGPILGYAEILHEDIAEGDPRRDDLEKITYAGNRAAGLVKHLLAFSRKQSFEIKSIRINDLLINFEKLLRRTLRENIQITMNLAASLPLVAADTLQLEQVIMNLAVNAQDAMAEGGELGFETTEYFCNENRMFPEFELPAGQYILLEVRDNGTGIDQEIRKNVFDPFFTTKGPEKGTGLGLSTVYGIVKQHNGFINLISQVGRGTTFEIYIPVAREVITPVPQEQQIGAITVQPSSETILLVEDDTPLRNLIGDYLKKKGYNVIQSYNGKAALELAHGHPAKIDVLITDVVMPELGGLELSREIHNHYPNIKILYMTGYTDEPETFRTAARLLHSAFLRKPFSLKALVQSLRELLENG